MASDQNNSESNIRVFRFTVKKMITHCLQEKLKVDFETLSKLCVIAASIINETSPYNAQFSREEMYFGMYFSQRGDKINKYTSKQDLLINVEGIILYKDLQKLYENRIRILNNKSLKLNKTS